MSGDPYPEKIRYCIDTWHRVLPDYEFVLWDTSRFPLTQSDWVREAFEARRYAFAADYIRLYALYHFGGIYLDCDVEVLRPFDDLLGLPYFVGHEAFEGRLEVAAFGAEKGTDWVGRCLAYYEGRHFVDAEGRQDVTVLPDVVRHCLQEAGYRLRDVSAVEAFDASAGVLSVFPKDWFCAHVHLTAYDVRRTYIVSDRTYSVHHFANSWCKHTPLRRCFWRVLDAIHLADFYIWLRQLGVRKRG